MERSGCTALGQPAQTPFSRPSRPTGKTWSFVSHVSSPGTGWPTCVPAKGWRLSSGTHSPCKPSMAVRPQTIRSMPRTSPYSSAVVCCHTRTSTLRRCGPREPCSGGACLGRAHAPSSSRISRNTTSQSNLPEIGKKLAYKANREGVVERFADPAVQQSVEVDLALIGSYAQWLSDVELTIVQTAKAP